MIRRHSVSSILMHWFNATCWLLLLCTGFALMANPLMQPVGQWWSAAWDGLLGAKGTLLTHIVTGLAWIAAYLVYLALRHREAVSFLREILGINLARDLAWCLGKGVVLVLGEKSLRTLGPKLGIGANLPAQGFYNAGQKMLAVAAVFSGLGLAASGVLLLVSADRPEGEALLQWLLLVHFCCAGAMAILVPVHVYMAALAPGEGPALRSMFTGFVPEDFARHHNPLWHETLSDRGRPRDREPARSAQWD